MAPSILVVRFSSIGDILLTTPLIRALRRRHPAANIMALTKRAFTPLLSDHPGLNQVLALEPDHSIPSLAASLRKHRFTHLLDLHGSLRSRAVRLLVPGRWTGCRKRRIAREILIRTKRDRYGVHQPMAERYFEAARELDVHPDGGPAEFGLAADAVETADKWIRDAGLGRERRLVALAPGAAHFTKRWPTEYWIGLVERVVAAGWDAGVVGGVDDAELCRRVAAAGGPHAASVAGSFGLQETGALLRQARAVVTGDTGVMHMATAVGTPVIALFGPTVEAFGFFPYNARATVLQRDLSCRPCSSQGGARCPLGHHHCLREIPPDQVGAVLERLLR